MLNYPLEHVHLDFSLFVFVWTAQGAQAFQEPLRGEKKVIPPEFIFS